MPQVSPPTAPENEDDLYEGAPAAPRQIPGSGTPIIPPKGDVRTGEPVKDWGDPGQMAGSAPNLVRAWARWREQQTPTVESVSAGGGPLSAGRMPSVVGLVENELHPAFQWLSQNFPREAQNLKRMMAITRYEDIAPEQLAKAGGNAATVPVTPEVAMKMKAAGGFTGSSMRPEDMERLARTPGSTVQFYPKDLSIPPQTPLHEAGHVLRTGRSEGAQTTPQYSQQSQETARNFADWAGIKSGRYGGDPQHQTLDLWSRIRALRGQ